MTLPGTAEGSVYYFGKLYADGTFEFAYQSSARGNGPFVGDKK